MAGESRIDPRHGEKRAKLNGIAIWLLVVGVPCAVIGFCLFMSVFFTHGGPDMDNGGSRAATGMILMMVGAPMSVVGLSIIGFANQGRIARYQAGEVAPLARDVVQSASPLVNEMTRGVARSIREGFSEKPHSALACPSCRASNDADARFCKQCGSKMA